MRRISRILLIAGLLLSGCQTKPKLENLSLIHILDTFVRLVFTEVSQDKVIVMNFEILYVDFLIEFGNVKDSLCI